MRHQSIVKSDGEVVDQDGPLAAQPEQFRKKANKAISTPSQMTKFVIGTY